MKAVKILSIAALAAATVMTSCSKDDEAVNNPQDGKLSFASAVSNDPQARATAENQFDRGDQISVVIENVNPADPGTAGTYTFEAESSGATPTFKSDLWWNDFAGGVNAYAWYPQGTSYTYSANQSAGIQRFDFLFADKISGITRTNWNTETAKRLVFKHKTAKVIVNLVAGEGIEEADISSQATVKIYGYTQLDNIDYATGVLTGNTPGDITPETISKTALLLPINISTPQNIFTIELANRQKYYYNATYNFQAEKAYTFTVTVEKTKLKVNSTITDWESVTESGTAN